MYIVQVSTWAGCCGSPLGVLRTSLRPDDAAWQGVSRACGANSVLAASVDLECAVMTPQFSQELLATDLWHALADTRMHDKLHWDRRGKHIALVSTMSG